MRFAADSEKLVGVKGIRWARLAVPLLGAGAGVILGLASNKLPGGFWVDSHGNASHTWLVVVAVVIGATAAVLINGVNFVAEYGAYRRDYERSVSEVLALVVGDVADNLQGQYQDAVHSLLSGLSSHAQVPGILHSLKERRPIPVGQLAAYYHELVSPRLRQPRLKRVERFSAGLDLHETQKTSWLKGEGLIGVTWDTGWKGSVIGGTADKWAQVGVPVRSAVALSVLGRGGGLVGVLSLTGPEDSLPKLWDVETVLMPYAATLARLMRHG